MDEWLPCPALASAGPDGILRSAVNDESCVWHRHTIHHRQIRYRTTDRGQSQRSSRARRVADQSSPEPFTCEAPRSSVDVYPDAMRVDRPEARPTRVLPGLVSKPFPDPDTMLATTQQMYWHREWIIRPGVPLFVLGAGRTVQGRASRFGGRRKARTSSPPVLRRPYDAGPRSPYSPAWSSPRSPRSAARSC